MNFDRNYTSVTTIKITPAELRLIAAKLEATQWPMGVAIHIPNETTLIFINNTYQQKPKPKLKEVKE
jgi:hypothetical protein